MTKTTQESPSTTEGTITGDLFEGLSEKDKTAEVRLRMGEGAINGTLGFNILKVSNTKD